jgi:hypothetical protein
MFDGYSALLTGFRARHRHRICVDVVSAAAAAAAAAITMGPVQCLYSLNSFKRRNTSGRVSGNNEATAALATVLEIHLDSCEPAAFLATQRGWASLNPGDPRVEIRRAMLL